jgi:tetratricopeptide (TPR) repeat protein
MGIRLLIALILPLAASLYIFHFNRAPMVVRLAENWAVSLPVVMVVILSALAGALIAGLLGWTEAGLSGLAGLRGRRRGRRLDRARAALAGAERLRTKGKIGAARRKARRAARLDPSLTAALALVGDLATEAGDLEEAIRCNERLHTLAPDSLEALVRLSANLEAVGRTQDAEKVLLRMGESGAVHPDLLRRLRELFVAQGRWEEALAASRKLSAAWASPAQRQSDKRAEGEILFSAGEAKIGEPGAAATLFEEAVRLLPSESGPRLRLGDAYLAAGRNKRAVKTWEEGYCHLGETDFLRRIVAQCRPGEDEKAKRQAASAMLSCGKMREGDPVPYVMASALFFDAGRSEEARKWLEGAAERAPGGPREDGWVDVVLGLLEARGKLEAGDRLAAESAFQKVAEEAGRKIIGGPEGGAVIRPA